jgi:hypothetical protein
MKSQTSLLPPGVKEALQSFLNPSVPQAVGLFQQQRPGINGSRKEKAASPNHHVVPQLLVWSGSAGGNLDELGDDHRKCGCFHPNASSKSNFGTDKACTAASSS